MPTDAELRDQAVTLLQKTTESYPAWVKHGRPGSSNWTRAFGLLTQIGAASTPTPVPVPQPLGLLDDMRAIHLNAISSKLMPTTYPDSVVDHNGDPLPGYTAQRSQDPPGFWDGLNYVDDDVSLIADPTYGKVYRYRNTGNSHNPGWSNPICSATELTKARPITGGQWDWYSIAIKWEPTWDWSKTDWSIYLQCAYPTISTPPLGLYAGYGDNIYVERWAGAVTAGKGEASIWNVRRHSDVQGHWYEAAIGVKWGSHGDGEIRFLDRCRELGETAFTERINVSGLNTWQWGTAGGVTAPQDPVRFSVVDKQDVYRGYKPGLTDDTIPTNYAQMNGYVRAAAKEPVLAVLGA